ncbi:MAG: hypothetical protein JNL68_07900, partial [Burkholderiales bacterium]|nr:hypothetical protein [Burkholderiales bacterium]
MVSPRFTFATQEATNASGGGVANAEQELAEMNGKIKGLKSQAEKAQGEAKVKLDQAVAQLERQRQNATEKLKAIKDASGDAWQDMRAGFTSA